MYWVRTAKLEKSVLSFLGWLCLVYLETQVGGMVSPRKPSGAPDRYMSLGLHTGQS